MVEIIGRVVATEKNPSTTNSVQFWVEKDVVLKPFDIVMVRHIKGSKTYAIITELRYLTDSSGYLADWVSSDFGDVQAEPRNERIGTTVADAEILYNDRDLEMPIRNGSPIEWADENGIRRSLGLTNLKNPLPAGWFTMSNGQEVVVDFEGNYLIGPEGAHLNIAGISGLATKTSYAMFLCSALQQKRPMDVSLVIFNVKGYDLLSVDEPAKDEDFGDRDKNNWSKCGLLPKPFDNVTYFYPYLDNDAARFSASKLSSDVHKRQIAKGTCYHYVYPVSHGKNKLPLLLTDIDDGTRTMEDCAAELSEQEGLGNWSVLRDWIQEKTKAAPKGASSKSGVITVQSWRKFFRLLRTRTKNDIFAEKSQSRQSERRQVATTDILKHLGPGKVVVIDIEPLPDYLQTLVVGDIVEQITAAKLGGAEESLDDQPDLRRVVIFADELNKYAPKQGGGSLTANLLEITERGRSLGIVLFGAEQFRSGVHDRVIGNCATNVFGRTSAVEIRKASEYRMLNQTQQSSLTRLPQGSLMLQHPVFTSAVVKVSFPRPAYAQPKGGK
jgi:DNA helicase HerA-like ATPase